MSNNSYFNYRLSTKKSEVKSVNPTTVTYVSKEERGSLNKVTPQPLDWRYSLNGVPVDSDQVGV
jgi:hypothetical protein